jgi:hypothetical protein
VTRLDSLLFKVSSSAWNTVFMSFSSLFQREEPFLHILQSEIDKLLDTFIGRVCKEEVVVGQEIGNNAFDEEFLNEPSKMQCGHVVEEIAKLSERKRLEFWLNVQKHYVAAGKYLLSKCNNMLKNFSCFHPSQILNTNNCELIAEIARDLPGEINVDLLLDEWRLTK